MEWTVILIEEYGLPRTVYQMLKKVWSSTDINNITKLKLYETMVLVYNSETWTLKQTGKQITGISNVLVEEDCRSNSQRQDQE